MGTGGTISGTAKFLKEKNPKVEVVGADPVGSILKHYKETGQIGEAHTYKIEGVGEDFIPTATDFSLIDRVIQCSDRDGLNMARRLAREDAIFVGGSSGMAVWVALEVAKTLPANGLVVVLLPDTGERIQRPQRRVDARQPPAIQRGVVDELVGNKIRRVRAAHVLSGGRPNALR